MLTPPPGFGTWSAPEPREGWLDDGHTVDETRELFASRDLSVVASSQLEVACFGSPDARISDLKANAENARLIRELGADKMVVGTDGPEKNFVKALDDVAHAVRNRGGDRARRAGGQPAPDRVPAPPRPRLPAGLPGDQAGSLGKLYSVRITAHDAEPAPEEFIASSGGTYRDLHIHDFDLVRWLTGMEIEQVYAVGSVRGFDRYAKYGDVDNVAILMTMSDGLPVLITGTRHNPRGHDFRMEVFGSEDSLSVGSDSLSQPRPVEPDAVLLSKGPYRDFIERFGEGLRQETIAFIEVMRGERENPSPPASAMEALRAAVACEVSREEGGPVRLSEIADDSTGPS
jgi:hypothetical protein